MHSDSRPPLLQLGPDYWFNVDEILSVKADVDKYTKAPVLVVSLKHAQNSFTFAGEQRRLLLAYLAIHAIILP